MARHHRRSLRRRITDLVDTLLGRTRPRRANLDQLFALPSAAITLRVRHRLRPTGHASVAFRPAEGEAFATVQQEILDLLNTGSGPTTEVQRDEYGYTWLVVRSRQRRRRGLTGRSRPARGQLQPGKRRVRAVLLCSLVAFAAPDGRRLASSNT